MYVRVAYEWLIKELNEGHCEIRLSAFQIMNELFNRSHTFRELLTTDFKQLCSLVCGSDPTKPLPPPQSAADKLKEESLLAIRMWKDRFGVGYPKLKIGLNYLKYTMKVPCIYIVCDTVPVRIFMVD